MRGMTNSQRRKHRFSPFDLVAPCALCESEYCPSSPDESSYGAIYY